MHAKLPDNVKALRGTLAKSPVNKLQPKPQRGWPEMSKGLSSAGKLNWISICEQLDQLGILCPQDAMAINALAAVQTDLDTARKCLDKKVRETKSLTFETITAAGVVVRAHPEVSIVEKLSSSLRMWLQECGLTPAARAKVSTRPKEAEDNPAAWMSDRD